MLPPDRVQYENMTLFAQNPWWAAQKPFLTPKLDVPMTTKELIRLGSWIVISKSILPEGDMERAPTYQEPKNTKDLQTELQLRPLCFDSTGSPKLSMGQQQMHRQSAPSGWVCGNEVKEQTTEFMEETQKQLKHFQYLFSQKILQHTSGQIGYC